MTIEGLCLASVSNLKALVVLLNPSNILFDLLPDIWIGVVGEIVNVVHVCLSCAGTRPLSLAA